MKKRKSGCMHNKKDCKGHHCPFHNPSDHHMKKWPKIVRYDRGVMTERICEHGIGHPDPDSLAWLKRIGSSDTGSHGCDGCCVAPNRRNIHKIDFHKTKYDEPESLEDVLRRYFTVGNERCMPEEGCKELTKIIKSHLRKQIEGKRKSEIEKYSIAERGSR